MAAERSQLWASAQTKYTRIFADVIVDILPP